VRRGLLAEAEEITGIMARGAERTAAIVRRPAHASRGSGRRPEGGRPARGARGDAPSSRVRAGATASPSIANYGALPPVECDPSQLNQVFMNVLANACDAIRGRGNIWLTTRTRRRRRHDRDSRRRPGIAPDALRRRIFDPFFTTKDVGAAPGSAGVSATRW
jgi:signal transduction histidine kinase